VEETEEWVDYSSDDKDVTYCKAPGGSHIVGETGAVQLVR